MTPLNANVRTMCCFNRPGMSADTCEQQIRFPLISLLLIAVSSVPRFSLFTQSQTDVGKVELFIHAAVSNSFNTKTRIMSDARINQHKVPWLAFSYASPDLQMK